MQGLADQLAQAATPFALSRLSLETCAAWAVTIIGALHRH